MIPAKPASRAVAGSSAAVARTMAEELAMPSEGTGLGDQAA